MEQIYILLFAVLTFNVIIIIYLMASGSPGETSSYNGTYFIKINSHLATIQDSKSLSQAILHEEMLLIEDLEKEEEYKSYISKQTPFDLLYYSRLNPVDVNNNNKDVLYLG